MPLFEVAILQTPTKKEREDGATETLVFGPRAFVARDAQSAGISAAVEAASAQTPALDMSRLEVLVRPFN
jgi:hypothetical protein